MRIRDMPTTDAQKRATMKYQKKAMTAMTIRFHNKSDAEVLNKLSEQENKTDYIRQLILADIAKEQGK